MHNHSNEVFRCRKSMPSRKNKISYKKKCCNKFIVQMIMTKITGAQCRMMTNKYTKFEKDSLKDSREKLRTKPDRRTDRVIPVNPPSTSWRGV